MTIIKGPHGRPTVAQSSSAPGAPGAMVAAALAVPTKSFKYLTIDPADASSFANALLPQSNATEIKAALVKLADAMVDGAIQDDRDSNIPAVYTYWGQFIDHDITAGTNAPNDSGFNLLETDILADNFGPQPPATVESALTNQREPKLDLDSVYGAEAGPNDPDTLKEGIYHVDRVRLRLGKNAVDENNPNSAFHPRHTPPSGLGDVLSRRRDLPRHKGTREPRVGDGRNDENTIISQFHTSFLFFHNAVVDWLDEHEEVLQDPIFPDKDLFSVARQIVRWTHQYLVVHDYLENIAKVGIVRDLAQPGADSFFPPNQPFMPLEFSTAAFRFGHSMVRDRYDFNMNFGDPKGLPSGVPPTLKNAPLDFLFVFTGKVGFVFPTTPPAPPAIPLDTLPVNWIIDWDRFTEIPAPDPTAPVDPQIPTRPAQRIDTNLAMQLGSMRREVDTAHTQQQQDINKHLARRNLLRGYLLSIPTGQHMAAWLNRPVLGKELIPADKEGVANVLTDEAKGVLMEQTPLWYYILREAELSSTEPADGGEWNAAGGDGNSLGDVGSHIVAGTLIGLIKADPLSYINMGWDPDHAAAVRLPDGRPIKTISDFFQFAGVAPFKKAPAVVEAAVAEVVAEAAADAVEAFA